MTTLADQMRALEAVHRQVLPRRGFTIVRVDGRAFHTYLRHADKPFDYGVMADLDRVAVALCEEIDGAVLAYAQSDEISVVYSDLGGPNAEPWFGGVVAKQLSVAAATATAAFGETRPGRPVFDARLLTASSPETVAAYLRWRQHDAQRNAIQMVARAHFSHRELAGVSTTNMITMLAEFKGVDYLGFPPQARHGRAITKRGAMLPTTYRDGRTGEQVTTTAFRTWWAAAAMPDLSTTWGEVWLDDVLARLGRSAEPAVA